MISLATTRRTPGTQRAPHLYRLSSIAALILVSSIGVALFNIFYSRLLSPNGVLRREYGRNTDGKIFHGTDLHPYDNVEDARCFAAASRISELKINLLALDFDMTIVDIHTGGHWEGSSHDLASHVRPVFKCLVHAVVARDINVAVATFSSQEMLISEVMDLAFPHAQIFVRGFMPHKKSGKQEHLDLIIRDLNTFHEGEKEAITKSSIVLIDDDANNIAIAAGTGQHAVRFDPDKPDDLPVAIQLL